MRDEQAGSFPREGARVRGDVRGRYRRWRERQRESLKNGKRVRERERGGGEGKERKGKWGEREREIKGPKDR